MRTESDLLHIQNGKCRPERPLTIRIKYCGGCNPEIDRSDVVKRLAELFLSNNLKVEFDFNSNRNIDLLILVNGCPHACLEEDNLNSATMTPCLSIQGAMIDYRPVTEEELPRVLYEKILTILS